MGRVIGLFLPLLFVSNVAIAGMQSSVNSASDNALAACVKSHHVTGEDALSIYIKQCESQIKVSLLECRVAGYSADVCNWALLSFMNESDTP